MHLDLLDNIDATLICPDCNGYGELGSGSYTHACLRCDGRGVRRCDLCMERAASLHTDEINLCDTCAQLEGPLPDRHDTTPCPAPEHTCDACGLSDCSCIICGTPCTIPCFDEAPGYRHTYWPRIAT